MSEVTVVALGLPRQRSASGSVGSGDLRSVSAGPSAPMGTSTGKGAVDEAGWQEQALCAETDPEAFFPEKGGSTREAKRVCLSCEVRAECLEYALENDERFGIWGGLSERERRRVKKEAV